MYPLFFYIKNRAMAYRIVNNRLYTVRVFRSIESVNLFLEKNPDWGVLDEKTDAKNIGRVSIYVARLSDKGIPIKPKRIRGDEAYL